MGGETVRWTLIHKAPLSLSLSLSLPLPLIKSKPALTGNPGPLCKDNTRHPSIQEIFS